MHSLVASLLLVGAIHAQCKEGEGKGVVYDDSSLSVDDDMASKRSEYSRDILSFGKRSSAPALERNIMAFGKRSPVGHYMKMRFVSSCARTEGLYN